MAYVSYYEVVNLEFGYSVEVKVIQISVEMSHFARKIHVL